MSEPAPRRLNHELFLLSFAALFWELTMIRYVPASVRVVGYFTNLVLLSTFLGLGAGTILGGRLKDPVRLFPPLAVLATVAALFLGAMDTSNPDGQFIWHGGPVDTATAGGMTLYGTFREAMAGIGPLPAELVIPIMMVLLAVMFVPVGAAIGARFARLAPLPAYSWDIGGSIAGIVAFTALSAIGSTPVTWFVLGFVLVLPLALRLTFKHRVVFAGSAVIAVSCAALLSGAYEWSPYQKIALEPVTLEMLGERGDQTVGYELKVNNDYHQMMLDLGETADGHPSLLAWRKLYDAPHTGTKPGNVLILGAGTGNDVQAALRAGASHVTAVDIDPVILEIGQRLHPERPYDDPRVERVNTDARAFFKRTDRRYDTIVFGFLDSHTLLSSMSSVRIDTFVYTIDSFREARGLLVPGGRLVLTFAATERWIGERLFRLFDAAFGSAPEFARFDYTNGVVFSHERDDTPIDDARGDELAFQHDLPTDDWPYFYLQDRAIPGPYILFIFLVVLLGAFPLFLVPRGERALNLQFLFLGAGFMFIETRSITEMALLFGSTWIVNSVTFGGILAMVLAANLVCIRIPRFPVQLAYALVAVGILVHALVPAALLLDLSVGARVPLAILLLFSPIFAAGLAFSSSFRHVDKPHVSFGSNLLGAMIGGGLEYVSMVIGFALLDGVAIVLYALAWLSWVRTRAA